MTMFYMSAIAITLSAMPILALCLGDPKRRRALGHKSPGMAPGRRRLLAATACLPGLVCALLGDAAAFLMWLGGCALLGWGVAAYFFHGGQEAA
jgi:hypothetical protein